MTSRSDVVPFPPGFEPDADPARGGLVDEVMTGEAVALDLRPASYALRVAGALIDMVAYLGGTYFLLLIVVFSLAGTVLEQAAYAIVFTVLLVTGLVVAPITVETATRGRSLGKLAVGARIVRDDGGSIGFRHAFIRGLAGFIEDYTGIALLVGLLTPRAKRLGDLMAGTYSQYERVARQQTAPPMLPWGLGEWARVADVARLPEGLARRVAQFMHEAWAYDADRRAGIAAGLAREVAPFVSPLPAVPPEYLLAAVVALRRDREARALFTEQQRLAALAPVLDGMPHDFPRR
jgi:uncharacterized RDD family membrane protein YckC